MTTSSEYLLCIDSGGYPSGGAGYVMGRAALKQLVTVGFEVGPNCPPHSEPKAEDILMGRCMEDSGVRLSKETVDEGGRELFHSFSPQREFIIPWEKIGFYRQFSIHPLGGDYCCSKDAISYHYVHGPEMLFLDYLFHNMTKVLL